MLKKTFSSHVSWSHSLETSANYVMPSFIKYTQNILNAKTFFIGKSMKIPLFLTLLFLLLIPPSLFSYGTGDTQDSINYNKHYIGASFGLINMVGGNFNSWYIGDIYYQKFHYKDSKYQNSFTIFTGYSKYDDDDTTRNEISLTLGFDMYSLNLRTKKWSTYYGVGLGTLHRTEESTLPETAETETSNNFKFLWYIRLGVTFNIWKSLHLDLYAKNNCIYNSLWNGQLSAGLVYSF